MRQSLCGIPEFPGTGVALCARRSGAAGTRPQVRLGRLSLARQLEKASLRLCQCKLCEVPSRCLIST